MKNTRTDIQWVINRHSQKQRGAGDPSFARDRFPVETARAARRFHRQIPGYRMSPLRSLSQLAHMFGVGGIWVKDESVRLELNSFKVLGGSFAIYRFIQERLGLPDEEMSFENLVSPELKSRLGDISFASATDGNHGRGIAWASQMLGFPCEIYVHEETSQPRIDAITQYGAEVTVIPGNYDDAVRRCLQDSREKGWQIISDTSWKGYQQVPQWIMQGYNTLLLEAQEQFAGQGIIKPTHIFVQAGVGALAASVIGFYHSLFPEDPPLCVVVEPEEAACLYETARHDDGEIHRVEGALDTIMAGLACGEPSPVAWEILRETADAFITAPDYLAAKGMRIYATPLAGDPFIVSGESGAVTLGTVISLLQENGLEELREFLRIGEDSQLLFLNTEGNTDPVQFRKIIWEGANPVPEEYWIDETR